MQNVLEFFSTKYDLKQYLLSRYGCWLVIVFISINQIKLNTIHYYIIQHNLIK